MTDHSILPHLHGSPTHLQVPHRIAGVFPSYKVTRHVGVIAAARGRRAPGLRARVGATLGASVSFHLTGTRGERPVRVTIPQAVSPRNVGISDDPRELGLALPEVRITPPLPADSR